MISSTQANDLKLRELPGERVFQKDVPYIMDLTFQKYDFQKNGGQITGYSISQIQFTNLLYIEKWGYQDQL